MKLIHFLFICSVFCFFANSSQISAHEGEDHDHASSPSNSDKEATTVPEQLILLEDLNSKLNAALANGGLDKVYDYALEIRNQSRKISELSPDVKRTRIDGTLANIARVVEDINKAVDAQNHLIVANNVKKLNGLISILEIQAGESK